MSLIRLLPLLLLLGLLSCDSSRESLPVDKSQGQEPDPCPRFYRYRDGQCEVREVYIPGGKFTMGRGLCPVARPMEDPVNGCELSDNPQEVEVKPFFLDIAPVRVQQFPCDPTQKKCLPEAWGGEEKQTKKAIQPYISYVQSAVFYMEDLCKSFGKRLIREDEWEFAVTAGGTRTYPWGEAPPDCERLLLDQTLCPLKEEQFWSEMEEPLLGFYPASLEGIYDLVGFYPHLVAPTPGLYSESYSPPYYDRKYPLFSKCENGNPDPACKHKPYPCVQVDFSPPPFCIDRSWSVRGGRAMAFTTDFRKTQRRTEEALKGYVRSLSQGSSEKVLIRCARDAP